MEMTEQARDLVALAGAECEAAWIVAVREYLCGDGGDDPPEPSLYGLSQEEAQALSLQVILLEGATEASELSRRAA